MTTEHFCCSLINNNIKFPFFFSFAPFLNAFHFSLVFTSILFITITVWHAFLPSIPSPPPPLHHTLDEFAFSKLGQSELCGQQLRWCGDVFTSSSGSRPGAASQPELPAGGERLSNTCPQQQHKQQQQQQQPSQQSNLLKYVFRLHGICHWFSKFLHYMIHYDKLKK